MAEAIVEETAAERRHLPAWLAFLLGGTCVAGLVPVLPAPLWTPAYLFVQVAGVVAMIVGVLRHRPAAARAWWLLVTARILWTAPSALAHLHTLDQGERLPWVGVLVMAQYPVFAWGLWLITRGREAPRAGSMIDAAIITGGLCVLAWTFVVEPFVRIAGVTTLELGVAFTCAVFDLVIIAAVLRLAAFGDPPGSATLLLAASAVALVVADATYYGRIVAGGLADFRTSAVPEMGWQLWALLAGAAALHPGVRRPDRRHRPRADGLVSRRRLASFVFLAVLVPAVPIALAVVAGRPETGPQAYLVPATIAAAVSVLLVVRLGLVVKVANRRAAALQSEMREREALERELRHRATHDPLTGLANRTLLAARLDRMISERRPSRRISVILLDLDGFREINDTLGHHVGDEVLIQTAQRLREVLPDARLLAHLGCDEFALLWVPSAKGRADRRLTAEQAARRALECLREPYRADGRELHVTGSAGLLPLNGQRGAAEALRDADLALYAAKDAGRNQVVVFTDELRADRVRQSDLVAGLRRALADDELALHYQPVVDLIDGRVVAVEALLRWTPVNEVVHAGRNTGTPAGVPAGVPVSPMQFIPLAEETGLIVPIGWWVLRRACSQALGWYERHGISVTVNVSGHQLREPDFADTVLAELVAAGMPGPALVLELTESTLISCADATDGLNRLRAHGVRVAIDDFGTGYSSLSYLAQLPVDILKIDRAFTAPDRQPKAYQWAFTRTILDLARSLDVVTIAEGVETEEQAATLRALRCPLAQGFLYSAPLPADEINRLIGSGQPAGAP